MNSQHHYPKFDYYLQIMINQIHSRFFSMTLMVMFCLVCVGWANAQSTLKTDTTSVKSTNQATTTKSSTGSSSSLGSFFRNINNAGKTMSSTAKSVDKGLEQTSQGLTKFTKWAEGYAPDSLKQVNKSGKLISVPPDRAKQKADSIKQKKLWNDVFGN